MCGIRRVQTREVLELEPRLQTAIQSRDSRTCYFSSRMPD